jgi:hypothetical protein
LDTRCKELEQSANARHARNPDLDKLLLGLPEFEDLYYFLAYKTRMLYSDLQLRFASHSITMDDVIHRRGSSSYASVDCTVRDIRNFLRAVRFHLLHPVTVRTIEASINHRKYQVLKANPLLPSWNVEGLEQIEREMMKKYKLGLNLDASTICSMFEHVDDVSTMPIPALLMKVSQRGLGGHCSFPEQHMSSQSSNNRSIQVTGNMWIDIKGEEEDHIRKQMEEVETRHEQSLGQHQHKRSKSDDPGARLDTAWKYLMRRSSLLQQRQVKTVGEEDNQQRGASASENVMNWLPNVVTDSARTSPSLTSTGNAVKQHVPSTPSTAKKTADLLPRMLPSYRMPFHGSEEFPHDVPTLPPKSASQIERARELNVQAKTESIQRDSSRLQDALQQIQLLQRENSQLQEQLSQASPPRRLFRRLSKARSRSVGRSPGRSMVNGAVP